MALETRHTEKQLLFNLLKALHDEPELKKSPSIKHTVRSLKAIMEPEDIALVNGQIDELDKDL